MCEIEPTCDERVDSIDVTSVQAAYKNGELEVTLPKSAEAKPRSIEIKVH